MLAHPPLNPKGSISTGLWFTSPPRGTPGAPYADLIRVTCSDPRHPCAAGDWNAYSVLALDGKSGHLALDFEPQLGRLRFNLAGYAQGGLGSHPWSQPHAPSPRCAPAGAPWRFSIGSSTSEPGCLVA